jgi:hypothetical protein
MGLSSLTRTTNVTALISALRGFDVDTKVVFATR